MDRHVIGKRLEKEENMKIGGLDIGTTGCKLTVFDERGNFLEKAYRDYPIRRSGGEHEVDVGAILDSVWQVIGNKIGRASCRERV